MRAAGLQPRGDAAGAGAGPSPSGASSNLILGALEEATLITWPRPQKALSDTFLVLAIVAITGGLLFGINVALAELSGLWYHRSS